MQAMGIKQKKAQMKIQQMAFMIVAVFFFFALVGLFFLRLSLGNLSGEVDRLNSDQAITSLKVISSMTELNCDSKEEMCLDEDKLNVLSSEFGKTYEDFWPIASIKVTTFSFFNQTSIKIKCPAQNCNYYEIYDNNQINNETRSSFVSICKKVNNAGSINNVCEIGRLEIGLEKRDV